MSSSWSCGNIFDATVSHAGREGSGQGKTRHKPIPKWAAGRTGAGLPQMSYEHKDTGDCPKRPRAVTARASFAAIGPVRVQAPPVEIKPCASTSEIPLPLLLPLRPVD